ncbi:acriflavin resistance protein [Malaciobacter mytili LMG 24559]|uniref:Acriflavin resistance protein n=1 Tax=Malaciobacter mytili LMG 24559 TaxID=1032238 RepID=A0AAX2AE46_9BACT|nr:efflux RND transporter permease subunit [Malaciobacter mytili]AXH14269.1 RND family efflux system, inner membrane transporter, AcrB family [Malaciobacter mytili LMG 24559]RXK13859.1 acriflavin resistance protein [Malaciobacter mytili LMG 24559]
MFEKFLRFFVENSRMNYTLFFLIFAIGIWSYSKTPKEIFPNFDLDMISVSGSYSGASVDILDKMAVSEIEDNIKNINGIDNITTVISPNRFTIVLELEKGQNRYNIADKVKDSVTLVKSNLPSDMDEPSVNVMERHKNLIDIALTSKKYTTDQLKPFADDLKSKILGIAGVGDVTIFGDSDKYFEIQLDDRKIEALDLNKSDIFNVISNLSYIFPIGKIEGNKKHFYISTYNGAKNAKDFENILIKINNKKLYLKDIAKVEKKYEDASTLFSFNGENALSLSVEQSETSDALKVSDDMKKLLEIANKKNSDINITIADDNSERIRDRLNIVISNILLGIILITILVALLINFRMSAIIAIGIPTSFVIAAIYMYLFGYTINMISLVGVLIAIGIVVDDAIVVSENIQQHIEEGYEPKEAAIMGAKEMVMPVSIASLTTLFSFLPILMISGTMGEVMKLIPIALSALLVASLIESFIFLPIHAAHTLKNGSKVTSWEKANKIYSDIIHFFMRWKKSFLTLFIILVPLATAYFIATSKFQMFPKFDATDIKISIKADENTTLEQAYAIVQKIEADLINKKDEFFIRSIDSTAGFRRDTGNNTERFPYVMYMTVELQKQKEMNFLDKYITPYLSFYYDSEGRTRTEKSKDIALKLKKFLEQNKYKEKFNLNELVVLERKVGPVKSDIKIGLISDNNQLIIKNVQKLTEELLNMKGIVSASNSLKFGIDEIKLRINEYGEKLGLTETYIGSYLSNLYLEKKKGVSFDEKEMLDIKIKSINKDNYDNFKNIEIPLTNGKFVRLYEVADFNIIKSFEQLVKDNTEKNFYVYANVNPEIITATEVLDKLAPILDKIKKDDIKLVFKGEAEKKKDLKNDMLYATSLSLLLIMLSMLYLFNSFRETFILMSVIPFSLLGVLIGHEIMGLNLTMPSIIGSLGLAGVVINDGIIMMTYLKKAKKIEQVFYRATKRFRPIILTTVTTLIGMSSLIFFPTGQAVIFQPIAIALGFGLAWGTVLNLIYIPVLYTLAYRLK